LHEKNPSLGSNLWATIDRATIELLQMPLVEIEDLKKVRNRSLPSCGSLRLPSGQWRNMPVLVLK